MTLQTSKQRSVKSKIKAECRDKHFNVHSPRRTLVRCDYCEAYTEVMNKNICDCCGSIIEKKPNHRALDRILNFAIKQNRKLINDFTLWPYKELRYAEVRYKDVVYEFPVKYIALAAERVDPEMRNKCMELINNYKVYKGFRILIPENEDTDSLCIKCGDEQKLDPKGVVFCPRCYDRIDNIQSIIA